MTRGEEGVMDPTLEGYEHGFALSDGEEEASGAQGKAKDKEGKKRNPFTHYYAQLLHQQNMLQDSVRTGTYQNAFLANKADFEGKVVLDVGTGSGILAFFAVQAGAKKVYAVEASNVAKCAELLVKANNLEGRIVIINEMVEKMKLPEKVDIIISEPIGFLLVHERMLETYVVARERWLKPGGLMMPTVGDIVLSPFTDEALHNEQLNKTVFWQSQNFYGVDLSALRQKAVEEYFSQPVVGYFHSAALLSRAFVRHRVDFGSATCHELQHFEIPFSFVVERTAIMHGLGCWFDIEFRGSTSTVVLSTGPECPGTHWYQCRLLLPEPLAVNRTQTVSGTLKFDANESYSYELTLTVHLDGTQIMSKNYIHLQDQCYHYLSHSESAVSHGGYVHQAQPQQQQYGSQHP